MQQPVVIFSDLDGTLLNRGEYRFDAAEPALTELRNRNIPLVLVSSKTAPEMRLLTGALNNTDPFACENGSLIMMPTERMDELGVAVDQRMISDGYYYNYRGIDREQILQVLNDLKPDYHFTGFAWMTDEEIAQATGLSLEMAQLAGQRKSSEPILWRDDPENVGAFTEAVTRNKLRVIQGGRFYHVLGQCDKGDAVASLLPCYEHLYKTKPHCVVLGDSPNDVPMLALADTAILMPRENGEYLEHEALANAVRAPKPGPEGWSAAVLQLLNELAGC